MTAEIIAIGTEILLGDIVNTNASFLAKTLASLGIGTYHQQVVGDNPERLKEALKEACTRADLVITSGGLGPTGDDLSKETAAEFFGVPLKTDPKAMDDLHAYFKRWGRTPTANNWKQADLPEGCVPFYNENGTAPGFALEKDGHTLIMLPGPPSEIVPMVERQVVPYLADRSDSVLVSRTLHIAGVGESAVEYRLHDQMMSMQNPTLAPYAKEGIVDLRITAKAPDEAQAGEMIAPIEKQIREMFGIDVMGADGDTAESVLIDLLRRRHWTLSTAEDVTGGWLSGRIVEREDVPDVFKGGVTACDDAAKQRLLGVRPETLSGYGTVSEETAGEMAAGAAALFQTDTALAVVGYPGPGESRFAGEGENRKEIPAGTMCYGVYVRGKITTYTIYHHRMRRSVRENSSQRALDLIRRAILNDNNNID